MKFYILWVSLLFGGCSLQQYTHSEPKLIVLKTPKIKFADTRYIRSSGDALEVELFSAGQAVGKISIDRMVCVDGEGCMRKRTFNEVYLNAAYPDTLMQHVLLGRPVFEAQGLERNEQGFTQHIQTLLVDINYKVKAHTIYFKDRKNKILIKIKRLLRAQ